MKSDLHKNTALLPWFIWGCGGMFYFYQFVLRISPSVMTDHLMRDFAIDGCALGILSAYYYNAYSALQVPLGMMLDHFGPRRVMTFFCGLAMVGCILFATAETLAMASFGRLLMGIGSAPAFVGTLKLITLWFPPERVGRIIGLTLFLGTVGARSGSSFLSLLIEAYGWRSTMLIMASLGSFITMGLWLLVKDRAGQQDADPTPAPQWNNFFEGFITVVLTKRIWILAVYGALMYVPLSAFADLWGVPYMTQRYGIDRATAASIVSTLYIGVAVGSPLTTYVSDIIRNRRTLMMIGAVGSLACYLMMLYTPHIPVWGMYALLFCAGVFFTGKVLSYASICETLPVAISGVAVGFANMIVMLSGVVFQPLMGWLLKQMWDNVSIDGVPQYDPMAWQVALSVIPLSLILSIILVRFVQETFPHKYKEH